MSFKPYPKYKESGGEWLGRVPEHWEVKPLKRLSKLRYGIGEPPAYHAEGCPLIRATNVHNGRIDLNGLVYVDPAEIPEKRIVWLEAGDIIVVRSGAYTGDSATVPEGFGQCIAGFDMVLKCIGVTPAFAQYSLLGSHVKDAQIALLRMRAAQPHLNAEELGRCVLVAPEPPEQRRIAEFLDHETAKIDALIAEQQRLIELLQEKRQAVISHAVTKGLNPDAPMKDSRIEWLGEVPEHWEVRPLKSAISRIEQGWSPQCESYPAEEGEWGVLKVGCVNGDGFNADEQKALPRELEPLPEYEVREGDILASRGNTLDLVGMAAFVSSVRQRLLLSDLLYRFRAAPEKAAGVFLVQALRSAYGRFQIERVATGTSASMKKVSQGGLLNLLIALPPLVEQHAILAATAHATDQIARLSDESRAAIALLQERRSALISAAVTGQIDVRGFAGTEAA